MENKEIDVVIKDGGSTRPIAVEAPSAVERSKPKSGATGSLKKKRRRGKSKRKIIKPYIKKPWQERRRNENVKRINRFRKVEVNKTHAPYNNNQFLMEIHKPEADNNFQIPSARTRDSSFSVDSEENYFYSLPEDEEDFLTREFSSVYEDAQCERLSNLSKSELLEEYLQLEAKYNTMLKKTERLQKTTDDNKDSTIESLETSNSENSIENFCRKLKEQEEQIRDLLRINENLRQQNERLQQRCSSSSEDSESDSSSTSFSCSSSSSCCTSPQPVNPQTNTTLSNGVNENFDVPLVNGHCTPPHQVNGDNSTFDVDNVNET